MFVDDNSPDGTARLVDELGRENPRIKCLVRVGRRGLSSACIEGILACDSPLVAVMDGDLQHDMAILPQLMDKVAIQGAEIAIGSRYAAGGDMDHWNSGRKSLSGLATWMSKLLIPDGLTDPMSGYFVMRRDVFFSLAHRLSGKGFKILLDIFASSEKTLVFAEVPYSFKPRHAGDSKLSTHVVLEFAEMLIAKSVGKYLPPKFFLFVGVGATGVVVHLAVLGVLSQILSVAFSWAQFFAIWAAMTSNFHGNNLVTYRERPLHGCAWVGGLIAFYAACGLGAFLNFAVAVYLFELGVHWVLASLSGAVLGAIWNFTTTRAVVWRDHQ